MILFLLIITFNIQTFAWATGNNSGSAPSPSSMAGQQNKEEVQTGLEKFIGDVDSHIKYFDEYSSVLSEGRPDFLAMKQISKSYKELKKLLPQDTDDRR